MIDIINEVSNNLIRNEKARPNFSGADSMHKLTFLLVMILAAAAIARAQALADSSDVSAIVQQPPSTAGKTTSPVSVNSSGLWFSTADGADTLHVHGYVQADDHWFSSNLNGEPLDTFFFRRIRPLFEGTIFHAVDYRFMPDFGQNNPQIQEAFMEWRTFPFAKLRVGKFKEPIGLEVLKADRDLTFAERSLASDLVPLRYMGAQVGGSMLSNSIAYEVGYFNGSSDGSNGNFQWIAGNEVAARLFLQPFAKTGITAIRQFGFGMAGSSSNQGGSIAGLKTMGQSTFFKYSSKTLANGQHNRISPQAYYYAGPVGFLTEYVVSSQDVINKKNTADIRNEAWQVAGSVMLTGEKNSYGTIMPRNSFEPTRGFRHMGALELAVRYSQLRIDGDAFPLFANAKTAAQGANERAIGMNWYLNRFVKLTTDYEHTTFRMALRSVTPLHNEDLLMSRVQLQF
jgi:phosphate-selective porin OprO and OprP